MVFMETQLQTLSPEDKLFLDAKFSIWRVQAEAKHNDYVVELNDADNYKDNNQTPVGQNQEHAAAYARANDPSTAEIVDRSFIVINQINITHENILGQFLRGKPTVEFKGRGMQDSRKCTVFKRMSDYVEDVNQTWFRVFMPAVDNMAHRGLHWAKVYHDPFDEKSLPHGKIVEESVSARDVLVDPDSRDEFYGDTNYRIHRVRMTLELANEFMEFLGREERFSPDTQYNIGNPMRQTDTTQQYVTLYEIHWKKKVWKYKEMIDGELTIISKEQYEQSEQEKGDQFEGYKCHEDEFYVSHYNVGLGTILHGKNQWGVWTLVPCINRRSDLAVYPIGDFRYYKNLQDLFNVLVTIFLDDIKESRKYVVGVDPGSYAAFKDEIDRATIHGGAVPTQALQMAKFPSASEGLVSLIQFIQSAIAEIRSLPAVSRGELPAKQVATDTVTALLQSASISHGRKDMMIRWFLTEVARVRYKIMASTWTTAAQVRVTDVKPGSPEFIPINYYLDEAGYQKLLIEMSGIQIDPNTGLTPEQQGYIATVKRNFERENEVEVKTVPFHKYGNEEQLYDDEQHANNIMQSGMTPTEFAARPGKESVIVPQTFYVINKIDPDIDLDVKYDVDFDAEQTKSRNQAIELNLLDRGGIGMLDVMKDLEISDAEGKYRRSTEQNEGFKIAERLKSDPQYAQALAIAEQLAQNPKWMENVAKMITTS